LLRFLDMEFAISGSYIPLVAWLTGVGVLSGGLLVFTVLAWHVRKRLHSYLRPANEVRALTAKRKAGLTEGLSALDYEALAKVFINAAPFTHAWRSFSSRVLRQQIATGEARFWRQGSAEDTFGMQLESEIDLDRSLFAAVPRATLLAGLFLTLLVFLTSMFELSTAVVSRTFSADLMLHAFLGALMPLASGLLVATVFLLAESPLIYRLNQARRDLVAAIDSFVPCLSLAPILAELRREISKQSIAAQSLNAELLGVLRQGIDESVKPILEQTLAAIEELRGYERTVRAQQQVSMSEIVASLNGLTLQLAASNSTLNAVLNLVEHISTEHKRRLEESAAVQPERSADENRPTDIAGGVALGEQAPQEPLAHGASSAKSETITATTEGLTEGIEKIEGEGPGEAQYPGEETAESDVEQSAELDATGTGASQIGKETRRISPEGRGGGRFPAGGTSPKGTRGSSDTLSTRPEVICWNTQRIWIPAVELAGEIPGDLAVSVVQNETVLERDDSREDVWPLVDIAGQVVVTLRESRTEVEFGRESYLLFKLSGPAANRGRLVRASSRGNYLVIAPDSWERNEDLSGPAVMEPEQVSISGFRAHFFCIGRSSLDRIAFLTADGGRVEVNSCAPYFELVGNRLPDANEEIGPLFGGEPPRIKALDEGAWEAVKTIVIGEEGRGRHKWRKPFRPRSESLLQDLPSEVLAKKGGWYFLRFYNHDHDLADSLDFRFIRGLTQIAVGKPNPFPSPNGHEAVTIEFCHTNDCRVQAAKGGSSSLEVSPASGQTTVLIPPQPAYDQTYWKIQCDGGPSIEVNVLVERIWWSQGDENAPPNRTEWRDTPLPVKRGAFEPTSGKAIYLWFPRLRWIDSICVGFEKNKSLKFAVDATQRYVSIPLRTFWDFAAIQELVQCLYLRLWIEGAGTAEEGIVIGEILAEIPPAEGVAEGPVSPETEEIPAIAHFCPTCDHARHKEWMYWCRRNHWYKVTEQTFNHAYARNWCPEWQGE
jgi:hypothetical protein